MLVQVTSPHFCAGLVIEERRCTAAAPILRWAIGRDEDWLRAYFFRKKWKAIRIKEFGSGKPAVPVIGL